MRLKTARARLWGGALLSFLLAAVSAAAQDLKVSAERIELALGSGGAAMGVPMPAPVKAAPVAACIEIESAVPAGETPIITDEVWNSLAPLDPRSAAWLAGRLPGLDASSVRVMTAAAADAIFDAAIARGLSGIDLFTDAGLRGHAAFYLPQAVIKHLFTTFDIRIITPHEGTTTDAQPFVMQALLMGGGKIEILYDWSSFHYKNPLFPDHDYHARGRVTETIAGPGRLDVQGLSVDAGLFHPDIERFVRVSPTEMKVVTSIKDKVIPTLPLRRLK